MAFKLFTSPHTDLHINVYGSVVVLNKKIRTQINEAKYIRFYFDDETNRMAIEGTNESEGAFMVSFDRVSGKELVDKIGKQGVIVGHAEDGMIVFDL